MESPKVDGLTNRASSHTVDKVVASLSAIPAQKQITLFAVVDHSGGAAKVGLRMRPTKLLLFGDPKAGTPLMLAAPTSAIDLPLKILVWQNEAGETQITWNSPAYLFSRHHIPEDLQSNVAGMEALTSRGGL